MGIDLIKIGDFFGLIDDAAYQSEKPRELDNFGTLMKEIRQTSAMTSSRLAEKSGISQSYISQLENNVRLPSDKIINKLAYALIERNNNNSNVDKMIFSSKSNERKYRKLVAELVAARDYMKVQEIPTFAGTDSEDNPIRIDKTEADFLNLYRQINISDREALKKYMEFLINK